MSAHEPETGPGRDAEGDVGESTAEREGIVDQQDAVLEAIEEVEGPDEGDDPMAGQAPTG